MRSVVRLLGATMLLVTTSAHAEPRILPGGNERKVIDALGKCVAMRAPEDAKRVVASNPKPSEYISTLMSLPSVVRDECTDTVGAIKVNSGNAGALIGSIAENVLENSFEGFETLLGNLQPVPDMTLSADRRTDHCLIMASPVRLARFFAAEPGSADEGVAARALLKDYPRCAVQSGFPKSFADALEPAVFSLRAGLATTALILLLAEDDTSDA